MIYTPNQKAPFSIKDRLVHAWNAFSGNEKAVPRNYGSVYGLNPNRPRLHYGNEKTIINAIFNRIAIDCSMTNLVHSIVDQNGNLKEVVKDSLNDRLTLRANIDQTARAFIQDCVISMFDEGVVAIVPIDTDIDPEQGSFKIESMRVCKILEWYPDSIRVQAWNEKKGYFDEFITPKARAAICENPFFVVMNEPGSVVKRLVTTFDRIDIIDDQIASGKLDIIIQVPYRVKNETLKSYAESRRKELELQLSASKYGIAYIDSTEHITQLNRAAENTLVEYAYKLVDLLYSQLGMSTTILDGSATEEQMIHYYQNIVDPVMACISEALTTTFLTQNAITRGHRVSYYRKPFSMATAQSLSELAETFTRNAILSPNEIRGLIGFRPVEDPEADRLRNRNLNEEAGAAPSPSTNEMEGEATVERLINGNQNGGV